jgi:heme-degrading monooxygenase HmoA
VILEVAALDVKPGQEADFERAMASVRRCLERPNRYLLQVEWETLEDHTVGFRGSDRYQEWRKLLHHFYDPFPTVEHYGEVVISAPTKA